MGTSMLRAISISGLGALFLAISPKLRLDVQSGIGSIYAGVQMYAPYSYVGGVMLVIVTLLVSFNRGSRAQ